MGTSSPRLLHPNGGGKFGTSVKVLSSAAAAESLRQSALGFEGLQNQSAILDGLRAKGLDRSDNCIYSIYFNLTGGYGGDFFSNSDIFFYVDVEGQGSFLVPQIRWNYEGGPILDRVLAREVKPGSKVVVRVLDDDTWSDEIWNNIMKTRVDLAITPEIKVTKYVSLRLAYAGGQIQLLDRNVVIDAPDPVATAEFVVPETKDGIWMVDGTLYDTGGKDVGKIRFACVWSDKKEWRENEAAASEWLGRTVFWLVLGSCFLVWFFKQVFSKNAPIGSK